MEEKELLLANSPICHKLIDLELNLEYMNDNGFSMLQLVKSDKFYGKPYPFDFFPEESARKLQEKLLEVIEEKQASSIEGLYSDCKGNPVWLNHTIMPVYDKAESVIKVAVLSSDITLQKQIEKERKEAEERFKVIFDNSPDATVLINPDTGLNVEFNKNAYTQLGYTKEVFASLRISDYEALESPEQTAVHIKEIIAKGRDDFETLHRRKDGTVFPVRVTVSLVYIEQKAYLLAVFRDITEQKQSEASLRESKERLEAENNAKEKQRVILAAALATGQMGVWSYDVETQMFHFTEEFYRLFKSTTEAEGGPLMSIKEYAERFIPRDTQPIVEHEIGTALQSKEPSYSRQLEHAVIFADGTDGFIKVFFRVLKDKKGRPHQIIGVNQDITETKTTEHEKDVLTKRLNYALDASGDGIWDWTPANGITVYSKAWVEMLGYEVGELTSLASEWSTRLHPDDAEWVYAEIDKRAQTPDNGDTFSHEYRFRNKAGNYLWILNRGKVVERNEKGEATRVVGTHTDISARKQADQELKESEIRFNRAIEGTEAGIWDWDMVNNTVTFSEQWKTMLGYEGAEIENSFEGWKQLWHPDDASAIEKSISDHLNGVTQKYEIVHRCRHKDGSWRWLMTRGKIVRNEAGKPCRWVGTNVDITLQKKTEENEKIAKEQAEKANRAKSEFLAVMSHELRTPLSPIIGLSELLLGDETDEERKDCLSMIQEAGDHLQSLIIDILDFSKIESGTFKIENTNIDLSEFVHGIIKLLSSKAEASGLSLTLEMKPDLPSHINTDPLRLRQILINLIGNALKFTEEGTVALSIELVEEDIKFSVTDTGIGMSPEDQRKVFDPFHQVDTSNTRKYGGTGLGLSISQKLSGLLGATLELESELGKGSCFTVSMPASVWNAQECKLVESNASKDDNKTMHKELPILIVEDDPGCMMTIQLYLKKHYTNIDSAVTGTEALEHLENKQYSIVLLDLNLPDINGWDLCDAIHRSAKGGRRPWIVAQTANALEGDRERCLEHGFDAYLSKPIMGSELMRVMQTAKI